MDKLIHTRVVFLKPGDRVALKGWTPEKPFEEVVKTVKRLSLYSMLVQYFPPAVGTRFYKTTEFVNVVRSDVVLPKDLPREDQKADMLARLDLWLWPYDLSKTPPRIEDAA